MLLTVHYDRVSETWAVVNTFDGVICGRYDTEQAALALAQHALEAETLRIQQEYPNA